MPLEPLLSVAGPIPREATCAGGAAGDVMAGGNVGACPAQRSALANAELTVSRVVARHRVEERILLHHWASGHSKEIPVRSR